MWGAYGKVDGNLAFDGDSCGLSAIEKNQIERINGVDYSRRITEGITERRGGQLAQQFSHQCFRKQVITGGRGGQLAQQFSHQ